MGVLEFGHLEFLRFGDEGFLWEFGDFGFMVLGILGFGDTGFLGFGDDGFLEWILCFMVLESFGILGFWFFGNLGWD